MTYVPVFEVQVKHPYYRDGDCPDFHIVPTAQTQAWLRNYRSLFKPMPNGMRVLTVLGEDGRTPLIPMPEDIPLVFHLYQLNPDFALFTDFSALPLTQKLVYTNADRTDGGALDLDERPPCAGLKDPANGFADIEIYPPAGFVAGTAAIPWEVQFQAKELTWHYYLLTTLSTAATGYQIVDSSAEMPLQFSAPELEPDGPVAERLAVQYPEMTLIRFVSSDPIPCSQVPHQNLQLQFNGDRRYAPLPNPSLRHYAYASSDRSEIVLFHVLKDAVDYLPLIPDAERSLNSW